MQHRALKRAALAIACGLPFGCLADWRYRAEQDQMTGKEARYADLESNNSLSLDFPYRGTNHGNIQVRQHPKYGLGVIVFVDKGQMLCPSHDDSCGVTVRFDDARPMRFGGNPPADHSSTAIFLRDSRRFIASASKAKRMLIQASFFHNGDQVMEFSTSKPLEWSPTSAKPSAPRATK